MCINRKELDEAINDKLSRSWFFVVMGVLISILSWLSIQAFEQGKDIAVVKTSIVFIQQDMTEIKQSLSDHSDVALDKF